MARTRTKLLTLTEAEHVLKSADVDTKKSARRLLNGDDGKYLLNAVDHNARQVYLPNMGRMFKITYYPDKPHKVWVQAFDAYAPCAWITIEDLRKDVAIATDAS